MSKWLRLLEWLCPPQLYESIEGDLLEMFEEDVVRLGQRRAKYRFIWNTICFLRPGILLRSKFSIGLNYFDMIRNYFLLACRHLLKSRVYSIINISGLAIGMTAFLFIFHYVQFERSYENFHKNADNITRVTLDIYKGSEFVVADCGMYSRIGPLLKEEFPEVIDYSRLWLLWSRMVQAEDRKFYEGRIYLADPSVFKLFSFHVLQGNPTLTEPLQMVITEPIAQKYFGRLDVVGKVMEIEKKFFTITAVVEDVPANSHLKFDFLLSHSSAAKFWEYDDNGYEGNNEYTYLLMAPPVNLTEFNKKLEHLSIALKDKIGDDKLVAQSLKDIHLYSNKTMEPEPNGNAQAVYFLMIVGVFVLCIAWINYINLSTARATERAREVGIRKVMGSMRGQLVLQFLSESILITFIAALVTIGLLYTGQHVFNNLAGKELPMMIFQYPEFWYLFVALLITGSLLAGFYPALVLSSFQPAMVLKGRLHSTLHGQWLRKGLVVFQFAATAVLMVSVLTVYLQINFLQNKKLGFRLEQTLVLRSPKIDSVERYGQKVQALRNELFQRPFVRKMTQSGTLPGLSVNDFTVTGNVLRPGQEKNDKGYLYYINVFDENYIPQLQLELVAGRNFHKGDRGLIINEEALYALGFKNPDEAVGGKLLFFDNEMTVIGVLKNFNHRSPKEKYLPMIFWCDPFADYFLVQLENGDAGKSIAEVHKAWNKVFPDSPFDYFFLDEKYNEQYKSDQQFGRAVSLFSILAALIACLGLFGLSSFTIIQRTKEIGIRKVLGASVTQIVQLLSHDFVRLVLLAGVVAIPFGYFVMNEWLSGYATRIRLNAWIFVIPLIVMLLIALITVSFQTIRAAKSNPVNTLKSE